MANRIKIIFPSNPSAFSRVNFSIDNTGFGYTKVINKTFITGIPSETFHVQIGATLSATMNNLLANLIANDLDGNTSFELGSSGVVYVNLFVYGTYSFTVLPGTYTDIFSTQTVSEPSPITLEPLVYKDISIRIFDTYVNERVLIEELASANACNIEWNAGDDLYKEIMASNCVFNMLVPEADDAHFIHLFSGDEQRYRVEVVGIDEVDNELLIWQGFLLPDQYNEPYQQVSFFVDFTATDMISSLKGKYLPPWYYQNTIPIAQVFAYCLANTGLNQNIVVKPSVVPDGDFYTWNAIGVDMREFLEDDKYKDCFKIIESLLKSNVLTLSSYRGYWWLEGVHRKGEVDTTNYQFDTDGTRIADLIVSKDVIDCIGSLQPTPNFTAITPWRNVNVNFEANSTKNLFTDQIVRISKSDQFYSKYITIGYPGSTFFTVDNYSLVKIKKWNENLNNEFTVPRGFVEISPNYFLQRFSVIYWNKIPSFSQPYNYTEAMVLNRWIESPEQPYVKPGNLYEFEMEFTVNISYLEITVETFKEKIAEGYYDKLVPFQIFINDVEKYSNRPSFSSDTNLRYVAEYQPGFSTSSHVITFKLKFNFYADVEGYLKVRFLMPIFSQSTVTLDGFSVYRVICDVLKLTLVEDYQENSNIIGTRDINYTQELDHDLDMTCTVDNSVVNSFSLGYPLSSNYFKVIDRSVDNADYTGHHYFLPNVDLELLYNTFTVNYELIKYLFENKKQKTVFLEKTDGQKSTFSDLWYIFNDDEKKLAYLKSFEGFPVIPKKYKAYPDVAAEDVLKYMHVQYAPENYANRLKWRLYGSDVVDTYPKTIAKALHGVQPEMIYRLEATALKLLFPDCLIDFYFDNQDRNFIPTTLKLDLFNGKTSFMATEAKFTELSDISYE